MTETPAPPDGGTGTADPPPPPPPPPSPPPPGPTPAPPLVRPATDRVFRGVCAAVGRATGTDPVLWRVLVVVLTLFGGTGLVLYLAGWLLLPEEGRSESAGQRVLRGGASLPVVIAAVVLAVVAVAVLVDNGHGTVPLLVVAGIAFLVARQRTAGPAPAAPGGGTAPGGWGPPPAWTTAPSAATRTEPAWGPPPAEGPAWTAPPAPPRAPRPSSPLGGLTVSAVLVTVGALLLAHALGASVDLVDVLGAALLVTGAGLLVGARWGRSRGLVALAVVLALALGAASSFASHWTTSAGDRTWPVAATASHRLGVGDATLDLRPLAADPAGAGSAGGEIVVAGRVGVGHLLVLVPDGVRVDVAAHVQIGEVLVPDGTPQVESGSGIDRQLRLGPQSGPTIRVDASVGVGQVEVRRVAAQ